MADKKTYLLDDGTEGSRAQYIRQEYLKGRSRSDIAKELGVPFGVVYAATANMDNGVAGKRAPSVYVTLSDGTQMSRTEYIRQEFQKGRSRSDIAKELGVAYQIVFAATKGMDNGTIGQRGGKIMVKHPVTGEMVSRVDLIRELFAQGQTRREIANLLGCDYMVVWNATKPAKDSENEVEDEDVEAEFETEDEDEN